MKSFIRPALLFCLLAAALSTPAARAQVLEERMIGPGVRYTHLRREAGPWDIHVVDIDGASAFIRPALALAHLDGLALEPVSRIAERATLDSRYPIAATNGDFFVHGSSRQSGSPAGVAVWDEEVISTPRPTWPRRSSLIFDREGTPSIAVLQMSAWIERPDGTRFPLSAANQARENGQLILYTPRFGRTTGTPAGGVEVVLGSVPLPVRAATRLAGTVQSLLQGAGDAAIPPDGVVLSGQGEAAAFLQRLTRGDAVSFRIDLSPAIPDGASVIGGGPRLVRDGRRSVESEAESLKPDVAEGRAPRTAVGFTGRHLVIVTVDGRQPGHSAGMTLAELADFMLERGCVEAMNLDGGGSSCMWVRGTVENRPSDGHERPVANALVVFCTAPKGPPVRLAIAPGDLAVLAGATIPLRVRGEDAAYNPVDLSAPGIRWDVDPALGAVDAQGRFVAAPGAEDAAPWTAGLLWARSGEIQGSARVRVYCRPPRLEIAPPAVSVASGATRRLEARAFDDSGRPLSLPADALRWEAMPDIGTIAPDGTLHAAAGRTHGTVTATLYGVRATAPVSVGTVLKPLDDFETGTGWRAATYPAAVPGSVATAADRAHSGARALKLAFDFTTTTATRALYARADRPIGSPLSLHLWFEGDAAGAWLRARLRDAAGQPHTIDFARDLAPAPDWRELVAPIPEGTPGPLTLESIYVVQPDPHIQSRGTLYIDDLAAEYADGPF